MLKLAGENIVQEKFENLIYSPGIVDSADLEAATHTIVPTTRPAIGSAQYTKALTLPKPDDARLEVLRIASRLAVTIDNLGTATHVYCSVRVDVDDADHELFNEDWTSTGAKFSAVDTHSANKAVIFNLLKDGAAHTFYFLFWADVASQAVISLVQLWEGVGSKETSNATGGPCVSIVHSGWARLGAALSMQGTGTPAYTAASRSTYVSFPLFGSSIYHYKGGAGENTGDKVMVLVPGKAYLWMAGTVATDINYLSALNIILRSEQ